MREVRYRVWVKLARDSDDLVMYDDVIATMITPSRMLYIQMKPPDDTPAYQVYHNIDQIVYYEINQMMGNQPTTTKENNN